MGAGKSTAADELAASLGVTALDSDRLLEERFGHPVAREFELSGEQAFRAAEEQLVCELLQSAGAGSVIALVGGSVLSERVRVALEPQRRHGKLRVAALLAAGASVIAKKGFEAATMAEIASKAGAPVDPDWYHNLVAHPEASIEIGDEVVKVTARTADPDEREPIWTRGRCGRS